MSPPAITPYIAKTFWENFACKFYLFLLMCAHLETSLAIQNLLSCYPLACAHRTVETPVIPTFLETLAADSVSVNAFAKMTYGHTPDASCLVLAILHSDLLPSTTKQATKMSRTTLVTQERAARRPT